MEITIVMLGGASHTLMVNPEDTVSSLKRLIQDELEVPVQEQKLVNEEKTLDNDENPLSSYNLQSGSQVALLIIKPPPVQVALTSPIEVFLKNEKGQLSNFEIKPEETVDHFKAKVEQRERVPVNQQRLLHQSREMTSGRLSDYNVTNHSTIYLMLRLRGG